MECPPYLTIDRPKITQKFGCKFPLTWNCFKNLFAHSTETKQLSQFDLLYLLLNSNNPSLCASVRRESDRAETHWFYRIFNLQELKACNSPESRSTIPPKSRAKQIIFYAQFWNASSLQRRFKSMKNRMWHTNQLLCGNKIQICTDTNHRFVMELWNAIS